MGKGSQQRPAQISQEELARRWEETFERCEHDWYRPMQPAATDVRVCRKCGAQR